MRLGGWHVEGYGVLAGARASDLPEGLCVVSGPNEAGKSTLLDFLRGVLFGFPDRRSRLPYREPLRGGRHGGRVELVDDDGARFVLSRWVGGRAPELDGPDGRPAGEAELRRLLGGADAELFRSVFAFGLGELSCFESLDTDAVRDAVLSAGMLGAGRSASRAAKSLRQQREVLARPRQADATANRLQAGLVALDEELRTFRRQAVAHAGRAAEQARLATGVQRARLDAEQCRARLAELDRLVTCWPVHCRAEAARHELRSLGDATAREAALLEHEAAVERLLAARSGHLERLRRSEQLRTQLAGIERERSQLLTALGAAVDGPALAPGAASALALGAQAEALATEHRAATATLEAARAEYLRACDELAVLERPGGEGVAPPAAAPTAPAPAAAAAAAAAVRPIELLDELEVLLGQLRGEIAERERLGADLVAAEQRARLAAIAAAGSRRLALLAVAALGVVAAGLTAWSARAAVAHEVAGALIGAAVAAGLVVACAVVLAGTTTARRAGGAGVEPSATSAARLDACTERIARLAAELDVPASAADPELAAAAARLQLERRRRMQLELDERAVERVRASVGAASRRLAERRAVAAEIKSRAEQLSQSAGLGRAVGPDGLARAIGYLGELAKLDAARLRVRQQLEQLTIETTAYEGEVRSLEELLPARPRHAGSGLAPGTGAAVAPVGPGSAGPDGAGPDGAGPDGAGPGSAGPDDADTTLDGLAGELRRAGEHLELSLKARRTIEECEEELVRQLGGGPAAARLRAALREGDLTCWEQDRGRAAAELEQLTATYESAVADHRDAERSLDELARSADVALLELRRDALAGELDSVLEQWAVLSLAESLLLETLARYERERQPRVLARAGELFCEVTAGRYPKLIARSGSEAPAQGIDALTASGERVDCSSLSRGTAEQLYLCLRLAYATTFAERATALPLVLDDVLVNFDPCRASAVARAIAAVAAEHQVLAFTCHPHVVEMLLEAAPASRVIELAASDDLRLERPANPTS
ncbi:MAG TPA: AAA family ATPase [Acidimicrobiales bacterium]|nr:AAA family ATPase [Acidimicrobiales bacterium]